MSGQWPVYRRRRSHRPAVTVTRLTHRLTGTHPRITGPAHTAPLTTFINTAEGGEICPLLFSPVAMRGILA